MSSLVDSLWKELDVLMQEVDKSYDHLASLPKYTTNSEYVSCFTMNGRCLLPPMLTQEQRQEMRKYKGIVNEKLQQRKLVTTKTRTGRGVSIISSKSKKEKHLQLEKEVDGDSEENVVDAYQKSSNDLLKLLETENDVHADHVSNHLSVEKDTGIHKIRKERPTEQPIGDYTILSKSPCHNINVETDDSELCLKLEELSIDTKNLQQSKSDDTLKSGSLNINSNRSSIVDKLDSGNGSKTEELSGNTEIKSEELTTDSLLSQSSGQISCQNNGIKKDIVPTKQEYTRESLDANERMEEACSVVNECAPKHQSQNDNSGKCDAEEYLSDCLSYGEEELAVEALYTTDENQASLNEEEEVSSSVCASLKSVHMNVSTNVDTGHEYAPNYKLLSSFTSEWLQSLYTSDEQESKETQVEKTTTEDLTQSVRNQDNFVNRDRMNTNNFSPRRSMSPARRTVNRTNPSTPTRYKTPDRTSNPDKSLIRSSSDEDGSSEIVLQSFIFDGRKMRRLHPTTISTENKHHEAAESPSPNSSLRTSSTKSLKHKERRRPVRQNKVLQHQNKKQLENIKINEYLQCGEFPKSSSQTSSRIHHDHEVWNKFSALVKGHLTRKLFYSRACVLIMQCIRDTSRTLIAMQQDRAKTAEEKQLVLRLYAQVRSALYDFHDIFFNTSIKEQMQMIQNTHKLELKENISPRSSIPRLSKATQKSLERKKKAMKKEISDPSKEGRNVFASFSSVNFNKEAKSKISHIWKNNSTRSSSTRSSVNKSLTTNKNTLKTRKSSYNH